MDGRAPPNTPSSVSTSGSTTTHDFIGLPQDLGKENPIEKDDLDIRREKIANARAHKLMARHIAADKTGVTTTPVSPSACSYYSSTSTASSSSYSSYASPSTNSGNDDNGYAVRQARIREHKERKLQSKLAAASGHSSSWQSPSPRLITKPRKECLATSTRKKKIVSAEEEYETIDDYKCQLHFDQEKEARQRALQLLEELGY